MPFRSGRLLLLMCLNLVSVPELPHSSRQSTFRGDVSEYAAAANLRRVSGTVSFIPSGPQVWTDSIFISLEPKEASLAPPRRPKTHIVNMKNKTFSPQFLAIRTGDSVTYINLDDFNHNVFSGSNLGGFDLGSYSFRGQKTQRFETPGLYKIYCNIHSEMSHFVLVSGADWAKITENRGSFSFDDVPPGDYTLAAWSIHGEASVPVTVSPSQDAAVNLEIPGAAAAVETHLNKYGKPYPERNEREIY